VQSSEDFFGLNHSNKGAESDRIVIIGAGFDGLYTAKALQEMGVKDKKLKCFKNHHNKKNY
jgi:cation diffusion facilitator CzcD-associated flavoprotein CzcO